MFEILIIILALLPLAAVFLKNKWIHDSKMNFKTSDKGRILSCIKKNTLRNGQLIIYYQYEVEIQYKNLVIQKNVESSERYEVGTYIDYVMDGANAYFANESIYTYHRYSMPPEIDQIKSGNSLLYLIIITIGFLIMMVVKAKEIVLPCVVLIVGAGFALLISLRQKEKTYTSIQKERFEHNNNVYKIDAEIVEIKHVRSRHSSIPYAIVYFKDRNNVARLHQLRLKNAFGYKIGQYIQVYYDADFYEIYKI